jgi:surface antigen
MKKTITQNIGKSIAILLSCLLITSCTANKQGIGTGAGLLVGGLVGSQFGKGGGKIAATILGAGAGALIGGAIGQKLDEKDRQLMEEKSQQALESGKTGQAIAWNNPDNGHAGTITPTKTYQEGNRYCREYTQKVIIDGKEQQAYGRACRQPDSTWQIIEQKSIIYAV